jgi:parallel beta-helix repeat protein
MVLLAVIFGPLVLSASAAVVELPAGANAHAALQAAIDATGAGDIIVLKAGVHTFDGQAVVNKNGLRIQGEPGTIIRKANTANIPALTVNGNNNTIADLEIDGASRPDSGIITYGDGNSFVNLTVHHCGNAGILFHQADDNVVTGGSYNDNAGVGLSQYGCRGGRFSGVTANGNGLEGITIDVGSDNCVVTDCTASNNRGGVGNVGIDDADNAQITNSTFNGHTRYSGITFQNNVGPCDGARISGCTINQNAQWGIFVRTVQFPVTNLTLTNNTYTGNASGTTNWNTPVDPPPPVPPTPNPPAPPSGGGGGGGGGAPSLWFLGALAVLFAMRRVPR